MMIPGSGGKGMPNPKWKLAAAWEAEAAPMRTAEIKSNFFIYSSDGEARPQFTSGARFLKIFL